MHVLILSANTGGGHNSAANAIGEMLRRKGIAYDIEDCLAFMSEIASDVISFGHSYIYRHLPRLFGLVYAHKETHSPKSMYETVALGAKKFAAFMDSREYDAIVSVHVFSGMLVTEWFRKYDKSLPHYFVATDYTCSPGASTIKADAYFIPHERLKEEFTANQLPADKLIASGIPVSAAFSTRMDKAAAREKLHLPIEGRIVLLSSGSMGCGNIHRVVPDFVKHLPENTTLVIICGRNMRSYRLLQEQNTPHTVVVGYTHQIADYMAAADLCVSKPGGLTTTEMLAIGLPMVLMLAVPGCESRNLNFLAKEKLAIGTQDWEEAMDMTAYLLDHPQYLEEMRHHMKEHAYGDGAARIVEYIQKENAHK